MKEGEPVLGGDQANPGGIQTPTPGTQPVVSATPQPVQSQPQAQPQIQPQFQTQQPTQSNQYINQPPSHFAPQPITSGTGDIVFANSAPKKSKKIAIILAIIVSIVVVGAGIYFTISQSGLGGSNQTSNVGKSREAFNY